ncbi:MAG: Flp pilus assembly complex ATPase component TadA [Clostridia bacterium]|nr:Flp pilus assembly complex ATPase component TadA [Clostridia bacterium]
MAEAVNNNAKKPRGKGYLRLGDLLISAGLITEEQLEEGLRLQKGSGKRLGTVLQENGFITESELIEALQMQLGIEFIDLSKVNIPTELVQMVPKNIAKQYQVVPVKLARDELYIAMSDPLNFYAIEEVRKAARRKVVPMVAMSAAVERAIQVLYGNEGAAKAIEEMKREAAVSGEGAVALDQSFAANQVGEDSANQAPAIRLVNAIIERAITERASDIHMEPRETEFSIRMRIDGLLRDILTVPRELQAAVTSRIKVMSGLDITERRVPQDGRFNVKVRDKDIDLRVSTLPTVYGEKIVARLLDKSGMRLSRDNIGLTGDDMEKYLRLIKIKNGVILVVGPTGSGKSTTMYTMIGDMNTREVNLVTLEDPVEYNIDGVNQVQINEKIGMTFASGLRSILRQDPDIIAVGEIRDGETAEIAMRSAITGHVVLSTIHTSDALGTVERLTDMGVEPYLVASALKGVFSQRLVRRICPNCRQAYEPSEDEQAELGLTPKPGRTFYRGAGCPECFDTGYRGRTAVFEIFPLTIQVRRMIAKGAGREAIESLLKDPSSGFISLKDNAIKLVEEGKTTSDEVLRVVYEDI